MASPSHPPDPVLHGTESRDQPSLNTRIVDYYEEHGEIYDNYHWYFHDTFQQREWWREAALAMRATKKKRPRVLDVGCGTGNLALKFLELGCEVVAVDLSPKMIELLRLKTSHRLRDRLTTRVADATTSFDGEPEVYDVICESSVLHHVVDYEALLRRMQASVAPGGTIFLTREPLAPDELLALGTVRGWVADRLEHLYRRVFVRMSAARCFSYKVEPGDQSNCSAHFYESGVRLDRVLDLFRDAGWSTLSLRRYNDRETAILSWLDNRLFRAFRRERFQKSYWSGVFQKPA